MPNPVHPAHFTPGVLAKAQLEHLIQTGAISKNQFGAPEAGASAVDLRLGSRAWKLTLGQRPTTRELSKILAQSVVVVPNSEGIFEFGKGGIYLVELDQFLKFPSNISARATGKSSVGRLDVITRLLTSNSREYDLVRAGYEGPLHVLLMPQTFSIQVSPGASVNQLRCFSGAHHASVITREQLQHYGVPFWYILREGKEGEYEDWKTQDPAGLTDDPLLLDLTVDLGDPESPYVYRALPDVDQPIDLQLKDALPPQNFFERVPVAVEGPDRSVTLKRGSFYIMKSRERLHIPDDVAVEVIAISERIGDIRIHYAGFAHPGFGFDTQHPRRGTPLIFEVRATDMDTKLYDQSILARIQMFRMSEKTTPDKSPYERQELKLSKVFAGWPEENP